MSAGRRPPRREPRPWTRLRRLAARLPARLLAFNLLLVLVPVVGLFTFGLHEVLARYERRLLEAQERSMAQQGRLLAAALSDEGSERPLTAEEAGRILAELEQRVTARLRVYDADGGLLADSALLGPRQDEVAGSGDGTEAGAGEPWLYRLGAAPFRLLRRWQERWWPGGAGDGGEVTEPDPGERGPPAELRAALAGRYGAEARRSPADERSLTLHVAIPVRSGGGGGEERSVAGAVVASQSTARILAELRRLRLGFFEVFLVSLAGAAVLAVVVAATISRPIRRLRAEAATLVDRRGRLRGTFSGSDKLDEVGDLARSLEALSRRVDEHLRFVESFAADVSHEFKNPLTSIRTATELATETDDPEERRRLLTTIQREVARMERLLSAVREISLIDSRLAEEPADRVELGALLRGLIEAVRIRAPEGVGITLDAPDESVVVRGSPERLVQVAENLIDNAFGFAPGGSLVVVRLSTAPGDGGGLAVITVADRGPGIPAEHLERIFDRFFTYRAGGATERCGHSGLGLAIVQAIVSGYGGTVEARNAAGGGAEVEVRLPRLPDEEPTDPPLTHRPSRR